ncbi:TPA: hypothetical protein HA251_04585 [Candidatus Woesearchaeota archaeon]|nr:hypothetical protein [Candidatus Woesearchaeota archaeon]
MVLPSDYLGPDAKEHDFARLTQALFAGSRGGRRNDIEVQYCQIPMRVERDTSLMKIYMQHMTASDIDVLKKTITLQSPSVIEINTDIVSLLSWDDLLAAFEHELTHHDMRTASFRKIHALANNRIEKENGHKKIWQLRNMVRFAHDLEELFAYEQGVENERATRGMRRTQMTQYHKHLDSVVGIIRSDEELYGTPIFEPLPLAAVLEGAYKALTKEDVDTYTFLIRHIKRSDSGGLNMQQEGYAP